MKISNQKFKDGFDILYNNIASNQAPGLDNFEISFFLNEAQTEIVKSVYGNQSIQGFEVSENVRRILESIVEEESLESTSEEYKEGFVHTKFDLPEDCWYIIFENVEYNSDCKFISSIVPIVYPTTHDEYTRIIRNPFRGPNDNRVLRLDNNQSLELVSEHSILSYTVKYIKKPNEINLDEDTETNLPESIHSEILRRAVELASIAYKNR